MTWCQCRDRCESVGELAEEGKELLDGVLRLVEHVVVALFAVHPYG
jgi:hypothetical protein